VFVDIDPGNFNISPAAIERAITPRTKAPTDPGNACACATSCSP